MPTTGSKIYVIFKSYDVSNNYVKYLKLLTFRYKILLSIG